MSDLPRPRFRQSRFERILAGLPPGARILDIGCWDCENLKPYKAARSDVSIVGLDRIQYGPDFPPVLDEYVECDLETDDIPCQRGTIDCIRVWHVLEHLDSPVGLIRQIRGLLKHGGTVYVASPNERSMFVPSFNFDHSRHAPLNFYDDPEHRRPVTAHAMHCWLQQAGFLPSEIEVGLERTPWQFFRNMPTALASGLVRDRSRLYGALHVVAGLSTYGMGRKTVLVAHDGEVEGPVGARSGLTETRSEARHAR